MLRFGLSRVTSRFPSRPESRLARRAAAAIVVPLVFGVLSPLSSVVVRPRAAGADPTPFITQVNFQNQFAPLPGGYVADYGLGYTAGAGFGWVQPGTLTPVSMVGNGKDRNRTQDPRLDTVMVIKGTPPPQWVMAVPNGTYDVTVSVGDYLLQGTSKVVVNGTTAIAAFKPTQQQMFQRATVQVVVTAGFIVLDAAPKPGTSANSRWNYVDIAQELGTGPHHFTSQVPVDGAGSPGGPPPIAVTSSITLTTSDSVDSTTISSDTIQVLDPHGNPVIGFFNTDAAGGVINFTPSSRLAAFTVYSIQTTDGLRGLDGVPFAELTSEFETNDSGVSASPTSFNRATFDTMQGPTVLQEGPDGRLYVANAIGEIRSYDLDPTTGLPSAAPLVIDTYLFQSTILGLAFSGNPSSPDVWVSRGVLGDEQPNFTGIISELTGANLDTARDVITGLPRSFHDHQNNAIHFGPDGRLYIAQGAMTGYGAPDPYWGNRVETQLSAAILVADVLNNPAFQSTVNVDTSQGYDPFAVGAPLTTYAVGLRNPYDFIFASNGHLYAPVNESAGGNTPAGPGNNPPALNNLPAGDDMFDDVVAGGYYGHPNPTLGHYTLMGANPTGVLAPWVFPEYPVGTQPDPAFTPPIYDLGAHRSADGIAEYTSNQFNGKLKGQLLMAEFSEGKDIIAVSLNSAGNQVTNVTQIASGFDNPLAVATDLSGRIYVAEYGTQPLGTGGQISVLQPTPGVVTAPYARVNFQSESAAVPTGYDRDFGEAFTTDTNYGWIDQNDTNPLSLVGNGVLRTGLFDQRLDTYMAMQYSGIPAGGVSTPGRWEIALPNGTYNVTASVGDASRTDSVDQLSANGMVLVNQFHPTGTQKFATGTAQITVTNGTGSDPDGTIILDAAGGTNTKIDYVNIDQVTFVQPDNTPPTIQLTPSGTLNTDGTSYVGSVTVAVDAEDDGGVSSVSYQVDNGSFQTPYTAPITITGDGTHTLTVNAIDTSGNIRTVTGTYVIDSVVPYAVLHTPDDDLGTGPRLLFSTSANDLTRPSRPVFITNPSPKDLTVTNLGISGTNAVDFVVTNAPALPFTIPAGGQQEVDVAFQPTDTTVQQYASFDVTTNDPVQPVFSAILAGADAVGFEGGNEPNLNDITHLAGYTDAIGSNPGQTSLPGADEIISPYWVAANPANPVSLHVLAHYSTRAATCNVPTGWDKPADPKTVTSLFCFPGGTDPYGGQDQMIDPGVTGTTSFSPGTAAFGLSGQKAYSDDAYNTATHYHDWRFFPAKDPNGVAIPHTWLAALDLGTVAQGKNYDYQDEVLVMSNADPQIPLSPASPQPGASSLNINFANTYPGTVADGSGNGTGFNMVMPNTAGDQYDPSLLNLDNANGVLDVTTTSGTMTAKANNQLNALGSTFDASRHKFTATARLAGPFNDINLGHDHQALWFGADQNDFLKV